VTLIVELRVGALVQPISSFLQHHSSFASVHTSRLLQSGVGGAAVTLIVALIVAQPSPLFLQHQVFFASLHNSRL